MHFGSNLKAARLALGLTQAEIADRCGVTKRSQIYFEKGEQMPGGAYLQRLAELGVDISSLFKGSAPQPPQSSMVLTSEERALIDNYRSASPERRAALREVGAAVAQPLKTKTEKQGS